MTDAASDREKTDLEKTIATVLPWGDERLEQIRRKYPTFSGVRTIGPEEADVRYLLADRDRLLRGEFTEDEFQNLCHNFSEDDAKRFCDGCDAYQRKLFGKCRTDKISENIRNMAAAIIERTHDRDRLAEENARLRELMKLEASMARLDQIDPEEVEAQEYKKLLCRIVDLRRQLGVGP